MLGCWKERAAAVDIQDEVAVAEEEEGFGTKFVSQ